MPPPITSQAELVSIHDHLLQVALKVHRQCQTVSDFELLITHLAAEIKRLDHTQDEKRIEIGGSSALFLHNSPVKLGPSDKENFAVDEEYVPEALIAHLTTETQRLSDAQDEKRVESGGSSPLFLPNSPVKLIPDNKEDFALDEEYVPDSESDEDPVWASRRIKRNRKQAISETSESGNSDFKEHSRCKKKVKIGDPKKKTRNVKSVSLLLEDSITPTTTGPPTPSISPDESKVQPSTRLGSYRPQLLKDALDSLPEEPEVNAPEALEVVAHKSLKKFFYDPAAILTRTLEGTLENNETLEILMSNPQKVDWVPAYGDHGALTFVNNDEKKLTRETYPVLTKDSNCWKYGGEYKIGQIIPITEETWKSFPVDLRDRLEMMISTSAWGGEWLEKRGRQRHTDADVLRNDLDFMKAIAKKTLVLTWVVVEFKGFSLETYNKLARAWSPKKRMTGRFWKEAKRATRNSRRLDWEDNTVPDEEDRTPDLHDILDGLSPFVDPI